MTKKEVLEVKKLREEEKAYQFGKFMKGEGFTETLDEVGNFGKGTPLFYRQFNQTTFFAFNILYYSKSKGTNFQPDFFILTAGNKDEFLKAPIPEKYLKEIRLGFDLDRDLDLYKFHKREYIRL